MIRKSIYRYLDVSEGYISLTRSFGRIHIVNQMIWMGTHRILDDTEGYISLIRWFRRVHTVN